MNCRKNIKMKIIKKQEEIIKELLNLIEKNKPLNLQDYNKIVSNNWEIRTYLKKVLVKEEKKIFDLRKLNKLKGGLK